VNYKYVGRVPNYMRGEAVKTFRAYLLFVILVAFLSSSATAGEHDGYGKNDYFFGLWKIIYHTFSTWSEYGILTGITNIYDQTNNFIGMTTKIQENVRDGRENLDKLGRQLEIAYQTVKNLRDVETYNSALWATSLSDVGWIVRNSGFGRGVYLYEEAGHGVLDSIVYPDSLVRSGGILDTGRYNAFLRRNEKKVNDLYISRKYKKAINPEDWAGTVYRLSDIDSVTKDDSLIYEIRNLLAVNVSEIAFAEARLAAIEEAIGDLTASYFNLVNGNVHTDTLDPGTVPYIIPDGFEKYYYDIDSSLEPEAGNPFDGSPKVIALNLSNLTLTTGFGMDTSDLDKVSKPPDNSAAKPYPKMGKKEPNDHDVLSLQNNISYLESTQDALYRDIVAMKVNTMAFIVALEAVRQRNIEAQSYRGPRIAKRIASRIGEAP